MPVLEVDGVPYAQAMAVARLCGRLSRLYSSDDVLTVFAIDEFLDAVTEINNRVYPTMLEPDPVKKWGMRRAFAEIMLSQWLSNLGSRILAHTHPVWAVGSDVTIANLETWRSVGWLNSGMLDVIPPGMLSAYPATQSHFNTIDQLKSIRGWMAQYRKA